MAKRRKPEQLYKREDMGGAKELDDALSKQGIPSPPKPSEPTEEERLVVPYDSDLELEDEEVRGIRSSLVEHIQANFLDHPDGSVQMRHLSSALKSILSSLTPVNNTHRIDLADAAAEDAQEDADQALAELDDIASDGKITPVEKLEAKRLWDEVVAEGNPTDGTITSQASEFGVDDSSFDTAYSELDTYLNTTLGVFDDMTSTTDITRSTWNTKWNNYFDERTKLLNEISDSSKERIDDIADDAKITPVEKLEAKRIWDSIVAEGDPSTGTLTSQASAYGVDDSDFDTAYSALDTYLNTTLQVFDDMTTTTDITRSTWDTKWNDYFDERTKLVNAIEDALKMEAPKAENLVLYLPLNGDAKDYSGNGLDFTPYGSPQYQPGVVGKEVYLGGDVDYLRLEDLGDAIPLKDSTAWSVSFWLNVDAADQLGGFRRDFAYGRDSNNHLRFYIDDVADDENLRIAFYDGGSAAGAQSVDAPVHDGQRHHCVITCDNGTLRFYVDRVLTDTVENYFTWDISDGTNHVYIGASYNGAVKTKGAFDEFRIYDVVFSQQNVNYLYYNPAGVQDTTLEPVDPGPANLIGHWTFDEGQGVLIHDVSGNGNNGTLTKGSGSWVGGVAGKAYNFPGDAKVTLPTFQTLTQFTIIGWGRLDTLSPSDTFCRLINLQESSNDYRALIMYQANDQQFEFELYDGAFPDVVSLKTPATGVWYCLAATYDGEYLRFYINGILQGSTYSSGFSFTPDSNHIGDISAGGASWEGDIDETFLYNRALREEEILFHVQNPAGGTKALKVRDEIAKDAINAIKVDPTDWLRSDQLGIVAYWSLNDIGADEINNIVRDNSGNGHDGTLEDGWAAAEGPAGVWPDFQAATKVTIPGSTDFDFGTGDFCIMGWFELDQSAAAHGYSPYIFQGLGATYLGNFRVNDATEKLEYILYDSGSNAQHLFSDEQLAVGTVYFFAIVRESGEIRLYINAQQQDDTATADLDVTGSYDMNIGGAGASGFEVDGKVGHFRILNRAPSENEIKFYMMNPRGNAPGMISEYGIPIREILDKHIGELNILNPAISHKPSDNAAMAMLGPKIIMQAGTLSYVALEDANIYVNEARQAGPLVEGDSGTISVGTNDVVTTDGAVAMAMQGEPFKLGYLQLAGRRFIYFTNRYQEPETLYIYAPYSSATVEISADYGAWSSVDVPRKTVVSQNVFNRSADESVCVRVKSDSPVVVTKAGDGGDKMHLIPCTREVMIHDATSTDSWDDSAIAGVGASYRRGNTEIMATRMGDGAGANSEQGIPPTICGDTYGIPHQATGYHLVAVEPCTVRVYYWSSGWQLHAEHDLTAASRENPVHITEGDSRGDGTALESGAEPWLMLGDGPFYARTNDESAKEYPLIGYRRDWRQYSFEQTIRALAGINVDGTVKADKVVTSSLIANAVTAAKLAVESVLASKLSVIAVNKVNNPSVTKKINGWGNIDEEGNGSSSYIGYDATENALEIYYDAAQDYYRISSKSFVVDPNQIYRVRCKIRKDDTVGSWYLGLASWTSEKDGSEGENDAGDGDESVQRWEYADGEWTQASNTSNPYWLSPSAQTSYEEIEVYLVGSSRSVSECPEPKGRYTYGALKVVTGPHVQLRLINYSASAATYMFVKDISVTDMGGGRIVADNILAGMIQAEKMAADNFFFTKAVGSQNRDTPADGDVRAYFGKDPEGAQGTSDPVELAVKEYRDNLWRNRLIAGMRDGGYIADLFSNGFLKGKEALYSGLGAYWRTMNRPPGSNETFSIGCGDENIVITSYDGSSYNVQYSTDGGEIWQSSAHSVPGESWAIAAYLNYFLIGDENNGISKSTDDGVTFGSRVSSGLSSASEILGIAINGPDNIAVAVGRDATPDDAGISRSTDLGDSFSKVNNFGGVGDEFKGVAHGADDDFVVVGTSGMIYSSVDNGASWTSRNSSFGTETINDIAYGNGVWIAVGHNGNIARSTDMVSWTQISNPMTSSYNFTTVSYGDGVFIACGDDGRMVRSLDLGITWGRLSDDGEVVELGTYTDVNDSCYFAAMGRFLVCGDDTDIPNGILAISEYAEAGSGVIVWGSNSYGSFIRFSNGVQICWLKAVETVALDIASSGFYRNSGGTWEETWPAAFFETPTVHMTGIETALPFANVQSGTSSTKVSLLGWAGASSSSALRSAYVIGIGRWK